jgi:hypothetical protein
MSEKQAFISDIRTMRVLRYTPPRRKVLINKKVAMEVGRHVIRNEALLRLDDARRMNDRPWNYARFLDFAAGRVFIRKLAAVYFCP